MSHRSHGPIPPRLEPHDADSIAALATAALCVLLAWALAGCVTPPPPYGVLKYDHDHREVLDGSGKVVARECHTHVEGGVETAGAAVSGQSCGDTLGGTANSITAFEGQRIGAPLAAAQIQAEAARNQALVVYGKQLGAMGVCGGIVAATAGAGLPALGPCLQVLQGLAPSPVPPGPVPPPVPVTPPDPAGSGDSGNLRYVPPRLESRE